MHNLHKLPEYNTTTFSVNKLPVIKSFFSSNSKYLYTVDKGGLMCVWKWSEDYLSDQFKHFKSFQKTKQNFKSKIKEENTEANIDVEAEEVEEEENKELEDAELMSKFELAQSKGRFILEKKEIFKGGKLKSC